MITVGKGMSREICSGCAKRPESCICPVKTNGFYAETYGEWSSIHKQGGCYYFECPSECADIILNALNTVRENIK